MSATYSKLLSLKRFPPALAAPSNAVISRKATPRPTRTSNALPPLAAGVSICVTLARVDMISDSSVWLLRARHRQFRPFFFFLQERTGRGRVAVEFIANFSDDLCILLFEAVLVLVSCSADPQNQLAV